MDVASVLRIFPTPAETCPLHGLYLSEDLDSGVPPFVYANYLSSLDGRIALGAPDVGSGVPDATANPRDWRLFRELAVQSDLLLVSGSYLRRRSGGEAQEILSIEDTADTADLREWRAACGLSVGPDVAVISRSLEFPVPEVLGREGRRLWVLTTENSSRQREADLRRQGAQVVRLPGAGVEGTTIVGTLSERGYERIYNAAGPEIHHLLLSAGRPDRLYLTIASRIVGGQEFFTLVSGPELVPPARFRLRSLYLDAAALDGDGQLLASYDRVRDPEATAGAV